ncbi:MAG: RNA polymerase sigma factor [Gammaproteobacteria bacterium]
MLTDQDEQIAEAIRRERGRLRAFIRRRVLNDGDAEDILQDVFYELVAAYRSLKPLEEVSAWLFRVARNRIIDRFRRRKPTALADELPQWIEDDNEPIAGLEDLLPPVDAGPDAALARQMLLEQLAQAIDELPRDQREVFVAHELEGVSFKEMSAASGVGMNTLLSRKRYAVLQLRERLQKVYEEWFEK